MPTNNGDEANRRSWFKHLASTRRRLLQGGAVLGLGALSGQSAASATPNRQTTMARQAQIQAGSGNGLRTVHQVSLDLAKKVADAAEQEAEQIGVPSVITIADPHGNLILQRRMDNAWLPSVSISRQKAYTAAGFEVPTNAIDGRNDPQALDTKPGGPLWGLHTTDDGNLVIFGGGFPLTVEDGGEEVVVGAIGSSGGTVAQDEQVAQAGVTRFNNLVSGVSNSGGGNSGSGMNNDPVSPPGSGS